MRRSAGIWLFWGGVMYCTNLAAQEYTKAELRDLEDADISYEIGDYRTALEEFAPFLEKHGDDAELNLKVGVCHYRQRKPEEAEPFLEKSMNAGNTEAMYFLAKVYHAEGRIEEAIHLYQQYKNVPDMKQDMETVNHELEQAKYALEMIDNPENVTIENMGKAINTEYHEYVPLVFGAEDELYFTSRRPGSTGGKLDHRGEYFEDVYVSKKKYGFWQTPTQLGEQINTPTHDACVGISPDGSIMYIFRTSEDLVGGDLYQSELDENGWGPLEKLGSDINSEFIESSASISDDGQVLYFSSNRDGGFGGMDIYRVVKLPTGEWSLAQNLGPTINTKYNEDSPFIHNDNKTLYFSSEGHMSMGGYDIMSSTLGEDGLWTEPKNLGYPINSVTHDLNFIMSADKLSGYYSSAQKNGFGGQDIYRINFKLEAKILSVVKGGVRADDTTHIPISASITLINKETKSLQGIYKSNENTGTFVMVVTPETAYNAIIEADGYYPLTKELYFDHILGFGSQIEEFRLVPMEVVLHE